jgi:hypothetical protein
MVSCHNGRTVPKATVELNQTGQLNSRTSATPPHAPAHLFVARRWAAHPKAAAADLTYKPVLDVRQPDVIGPSVGASVDVVAAASRGGSKAYLDL